MNKKIINACTVTQSTEFFMGMIAELREQGAEVIVVSSNGPELQKLRDTGAKTVASMMKY